MKRAAELIIADRLLSSVWDLLRGGEEKVVMISRCLDFNHWSCGRDGGCRITILVRPIVIVRINDIRYQPTNLVLDLGSRTS